jgi:hypothetical protein
VGYGAVASEAGHVGIEEPEDHSTMWSLSNAAAPPNKELKLTKPCTIGASQLNSSVRRTSGR